MVACNPGEPGTVRVQAAKHMNCPEDNLKVREVRGPDPETRRYRVSGCGQVEMYLCADEGSRDLAGPSSELDRAVRVLGVGPTGSAVQSRRNGSGEA